MVYLRKSYQTIHAKTQASALITRLIFSSLAPDLKRLNSGYLIHYNTKQHGTA